MPRAGLGRWRSRCCWCSSRWACSPGPTGWVEAAVSPARGALRALVTGDAAADRPDDRPHHPARLRGRAPRRRRRRRWKAQVNENAKAPAFAGTIPELCHNEIAGWGQHGDMTRQVFTLVELRHDEEHPQELRRFELVRDLMAEVVHDVVEVRAVGEGPLAQLFDLTLVGDFVSLHLAAQEGIDPGPVPVLDDLKRALPGLLRPSPTRGWGRVAEDSSTAGTNDGQAALVP